MNKSSFENAISTHTLLKYTTIVVVMIIMVIFYVWQNVEVLKMKLAYQDSKLKQKRIIVENDRLIYEIEKLKRIDKIEILAQENDLKEIDYEDVFVIQKDADK